MSPSAPPPHTRAAALLRRELTHGAMRVTILGSNRYKRLHQRRRRNLRPGGAGPHRRVFPRRRTDRRQGNINLVAPAPTRKRGALARLLRSAYLYYLVPKVILFREEHTRRVLVPKVDFISSPGTSAPGVYRPGTLWPAHRARLVFLRQAEASLPPGKRAPGHSVEEIRDQTGFEFECPDQVPFTSAPEPEILALIRGQIRKEIAETYPRFASTFAT